MGLGPSFHKFSGDLVCNIVVCFLDMVKQTGVLNPNTFSPLLQCVWRSQQCFSVLGSKPKKRDCFWVTILEFWAHQQTNRDLWRVRPVCISMLYIAIYYFKHELIYYSLSNVFYFWFLNSQFIKLNRLQRIWFVCIVF